MFASPGAIAFQLGPFVVRWYGILTAAAIVVGLWLVGRQARAEGLPEEKISSCVMWGVVTGYIGARLYEVAFNWDYYGRNWAKIPAVWEGGLAIHGGLIVGCSVAAGLAAWRRLPVLRILDIGGHQPWRSLRPSGAGGTSSTRRPSGGRPICPGASTSRLDTGRSSTGARSSSTRPFSTNRSGTWRCSRRSSAGSARAGVTGRERCSSGISACTRWGRFAIESLRLDSFWAGGYRVPQLASLAGIAISICGLLWVSRGARGGTRAA